MVWKEPVYPDDAPKFTPEDKYRDPVALLEYREAVARRKQVDVEKARVIVLKCHRSAGCMLTPACTCAIRCKRSSLVME